MIIDMDEIRALFVLMDGQITSGVKKYLINKLHLQHLDAIKMVLLNGILKENMNVCFY